MAARMSSACSLVEALNIGRDNVPKYEKPAVLTPKYCIFCTVIVLAMLHIFSNLLAAFRINESHPVIGDLAQVRLPTVGTPNLQHSGNVGTPPVSSSRSKIEILEGITSATRDLDKEDKAFAQGDIAEVKGLEHDVGQLLKKARIARHALPSGGSFDAQLDALAARAAENAARTGAFEKSAAGLRGDASAHEHATQAVRTEEGLVKEGVAALQHANRAREEEERLLKSEKELMEKAKASLASGDSAAARRHAAEAAAVGERERKAAAEATAAGEAAVGFERRGLRESRGQWDTKDGAAWPELGHEHAKTEHARLHLKHVVSDFQRQQKADDKKQQKLFGKLSKLTSKIHE